MSLTKLRLARTEGVGPVTYRRLLRRFGTADAALDALPGLAREAGRAAAPQAPDMRRLEREMEGLARLGGRMLFWGDADYPPLLALLDAGPPVLSVLGDVDCLRGRAVALVGARNASANGQRMAELMASELALSGAVVVSGLARGIDAAAHRGAMRTGRTVAAVAGGVDMPYPPENVDLQAEIIERGGAVVAEAPLGTAPQARHFPRRNRVIAGLSLGVIVVEAAPRSGSLITAQMALDMGRELFAVPGSPLDPRCRGSNDLIRSKDAILTESAADVLPNLRDLLLQEADHLHAGSGFAEEPPPFEDVDVVRLAVLQLLSPESVPVDDLVRRCQFSAAAVLGVLEELEVEGLIQRVGSQVCLIVV